MRLQDQFATVLLALGEKEMPSRSSKYRTFTRKQGGFYFLGKSGALRYGKSSSQSFAASDKFKKALLSPPYTSLHKPLLKEES